MASSIAKPIPNPFEPDRSIRCICLLNNSIMVVGFRFKSSRLSYENTKMDMDKLPLELNNYKV